MFKKVTAFALLIAVVLASFPTISVFAADPTSDRLEEQWEKLIDRYEVQAFSHEKAHKLVENYLKTNPKASTSAKAEVQKHLSICNSALASAQAIVARHAGFDSAGDVIDRALAKKSVKDLAAYLQQHAGSVKNLKEHTGN